MSPTLRGVLAATAVVALAAPALIVRNAPQTPERLRVTSPLAQRVVPVAELPPVEPTHYVELAPEDARAVNASVGFSSAPNPAARPFRFAGGAEELARATDCLAAAVIYEAGDDAPGERAVAQVIINRLRHPAFPKTICGVVFQGQERSTGCQFTFTCDGALARWRPSEAGWRRAREIAGMALKGSVYRPVGHATHYHTDWVVPYWSSSLDKITAVGTHLFFRWTGWWGTPPAFNRRQAGPEPNIAKIAAFSPAHSGADAVIPEGELLGAAENSAITAYAPPLAVQPDSFLATIPKGLAPELWPALALKTCGDRAYCKVMAWTDPRLAPSSLPLTTAQIASLSFSYLRDRADAYDKALWNCRQTKRVDPAQCMKQQVLLPMAAPPRSEPAAGSAIRRGPATLDGVRRRGPETSATAPSADSPNSAGTGTTPLPEPGAPRP